MTSSESPVPTSPASSSGQLSTNISTSPQRPPVRVSQHTKQASVLQNNSSSNVWPTSSNSPKTNDVKPNLGNALNFTGGSGYRSTSSFGPRSSVSHYSTPTPHHGAGINHYSTPHTYYATMETSYLPSTPFYATSGLDGAGETGFLSHHSHANSSHLPHNGHHQFASQSYPHNTTGAGLGNYSGNAEALNYSKDSTWKFQVL